MTDAIDSRAAPLLVACGGAAGALARWGIGTVTSDPAGTLGVNVVGSLLLGWLTTRRLSDAVRLTAATGFCSSFTTYSAFTLNTLALEPPLAGAYLVGTYLLGLFGAALGTRLGGRA